MSKRKCACKHLGQCPVNDYCHPLARTYADGTKVFRALTGGEQRTSRLTRMVQGRPQILRQPEPGDQVATDGEGNTDVVAKALDPERAIAYARDAVESKSKCKAHSFMWRATHKVPADDLFVGAEQATPSLD